MHHRHRAHRYSVYRNVRCCPCDPCSLCGCFMILFLLLLFGLLGGFAWRAAAACLASSPPTGTPLFNIDIQFPGYAGLRKVQAAATPAANSSTTCSKNVAAALETREFWEISGMHFLQGMGAFLVLFCVLPTLWSITLCTICCLAEWGLLLCLPASGITRYVETDSTRPCSPNDTIGEDV